MKKLLTGIVMFCVLSVTVMAQDSTSKSGRSKPENRKEMKRKMQQELQLSPEQGKEMKGINKDFKSKAQAIKDDTNLTEEQRKTQLKSLNKERTEKVNTVLNPEQQKKMEAMKKERMKEGKHPRKRGA